MCQQHIDCVDARFPAADHYGIHYIDPMLLRLPDHDVLYDALVARDAAYDGRAYVGVTSTGVFCRLTCPACPPKPENCRFFETVAGCIEAGFRPCNRCHPLAPAASAPPSPGFLASLLATLRESNC
jgi:AraC family transcriptional regulator of adaptative response/methylated-DNA-[protein]-cysteine methyltransferase